MARDNQTFNDGLCTIYEVKNAAKPGDMPVQQLDAIKARLRYQNRTIGVSRYWAAQQNNVRLDKLLRMPRRECVSPQDVCVLPDGRQYRIVQVQHPTDVVPPSMDLSLERIEQVYATP